MDFDKRCEKCNIFFDSNHNLESHKLEVCKKSYICQFCNKDFKEKYRLE